MVVTTRKSSPLPQKCGEIIYSPECGIQPFSVPPLAEYREIVGEASIERLLKAAESVRGLRLSEINATAQGGGVAEMLFSSIPFMNLVGIKAEWRVIQGSPTFYQHTKNLHNMLQGKPGDPGPELEQEYMRVMEDYARANSLDSSDLVIVNDPQPLGLAKYLRHHGSAWLWRCHIDIEDSPAAANPWLWDFMSGWLRHYDAAIYSAAHYVVPQWPGPNFIIPPFIDPLSEKNRALTEDEIRAVLDRYQINPGLPLILQVGRFDPWKGIDRTIKIFRLVRQLYPCQLIIAGGMASDDPEGAEVLDKIRSSVSDGEDIRVLRLSLEDRLNNWKEVNALQRAASIIMQPSTREGFGLTVTEALWKAKPIITTGIGGIPLQVRDGDTGLFCTTPSKTAQKIVYLLKHPTAAEKLGRRGQLYVKDHFLMPDRITDYLKTARLVLDKRQGQTLPPDSIISFHPWFKQGHRQYGRPRAPR